MLLSIKTINFSKLHNNHFCTSDDLDSWFGMAATSKAACSLAGLVWDGSCLTRPLPLWLCSRAWHLAYTVPSGPASTYYSLALQE